MNKRPRHEPVEEPSDSSEDSESESTSSEEENDTHAQKYTHLESTPAAISGPNIQCQLSPHRTPVKFDSYEEYDVHYAKEHMNRCSECHKNLPSPHFLDLHISECHDPLNSVRKVKGEKTVRLTL